MRLVSTALLLALTATTASAQMIFDVPDQTVVTTGAFSYPAAVGDVDGDGLPDAIVGKGTAIAEIELLRNVDGALTAPTVVDVGAASALQLVDVDGDGDLDLVTAADGAAVRLNDGTGAFGAPIAIAGAPSDGASLAVADVSGDAIPDVVIGAGTLLPLQGALWLALGNGDGTFAPATMLESNPIFAYLHVFTGDFDGDGTADIVTTLSSLVQSQVRVLPALGGGAFGPPTLFGIGLSKGDGAQPVDVDGDGALDLVFSSTFGIGLKRGDGAGGFSPASVVFSGEILTTLAIADFDGDGDVDLAGIDDAQLGLLFFENDGTGSFEIDLRHSDVILGEAWITADFDADGFADLARGKPDLDPVFEVYRNHAYAADEPWTELGTWLADATVEPQIPAIPILLADGTLEAGTPISLELLRHGVGSNVGFLVIGIDALEAPLFGGVLVPSPDVLIGPIDFNPQAITLTGTMPGHLPAGTELFMQTWFVPTEFAPSAAASNAVVGTVP